MDEELFKKNRKVLRVALMGVELRGGLEQLASHVGIAGGVESLKKMIADENEIKLIDMGVLGLSLNLNLVPMN